MQTALPSLCVLCVLSRLSFFCVFHWPRTSKLTTSPGSHSANTSKGRQQTSQSVVNCCSAMLVSITRSNSCPQNGHWMDSEASIACLCQCSELSISGKWFYLGRLRCEVSA